MEERRVIAGTKIRRRQIAACRYFVNFVAR